MADRLQWEVEGRDWPQRASSRFVEAGGVRWHVQEKGAGPRLLLVHGTGASTHSWRGLLPLLAANHRVLAMDLPGHGFTGALPREATSLPGVADALQALLERLKFAPDLVVGHSAGAAILARMAIDRAIEPRAFVSINGALMPLPGVPGAVFLPIARLLAVNSLAARLFAWRAADPAAVKRLVASTGSHIDREGVELYGRLMRNPAHVMGTLQMMAGWDLESLARDLTKLDVPLLLVVGTHDGTVPPSEAERAQALVQGSRQVRLEGLGHLAHEEKPAEALHAIRAFADPLLA
jgi:magnesium chelatase accessory protein